MISNCSKSNDMFWTLGLRDFETSGLRDFFDYDH